MSDLRGPHQTGKVIDELPFVSLLLKVYWSLPDVTNTPIEKGPTYPPGGGGGS